MAGDRKQVSCCQCYTVPLCGEACRKYPLNDFSGRWSIQMTKDTDVCHAHACQGAVGNAEHGIFGDALGFGRYAFYEVINSSLKLFRCSIEHKCMKHMFGFMNYYRVKGPVSGASSLPAIAEALGLSPPVTGPPPSSGVTLCLLLLCRVFFYWPHFFLFIVLSSMCASLNTKAWSYFLNAS